MAESVKKQLEDLPYLGSSSLKVLWQKLTGTDPPPVRKNILVRILAHKIQEDASGGPIGPLVRRLTKLAASTQGGIVPPKQKAVAPHTKVGARMIREWQGKTHEVTLTDAGYVYRGKHYRSLSEIARLITGTRWSGPLFFGLKQSASTSSSKPSEAATYVD